MSYERFTDATRLVFQRGRALQSERRHLLLDVEHVLLALVRGAGELGSELLDRLQLPVAAVAGELERELGRLPRADGPVDDHGARVPVTPGLQRVLRRAEEQSDQLGDARVGIEHLLLAISGEAGSAAARILRSYEVTQERVALELVELRHPLLSAEEPPDAALDELPDEQPTLEERVARLELEVARMRSAAVGAQPPPAEPPAALREAQQRIATLERQNSYLQELLRITQDNLAYTRDLLEKELAARPTAPEPE